MADDIQSVVMDAVTEFGPRHIDGKLLDEPPFGAICATIERHCPLPDRARGTNDQLEIAVREMVVAYGAGWARAIDGTSVGWSSRWPRAVAAIRLLVAKRVAETRRTLREVYKIAGLRFTSPASTRVEGNGPTPLDGQSNVDPDDDPPPDEEVFVPDAFAPATVLSALLIEGACDCYRRRQQADLALAERFSFNCIRKLTDLLMRLGSHTEPVSEFIWKTWEKNNGEVCAKIEAFCNGPRNAPTTWKLRKALVDAFNVLVEGPLLYQFKPFNELPVSQATRDLMTRHQSQTWNSPVIGSTRVNRALLEDAFSAELEKRTSPRNLTTNETQHLNRCLRQHQLTSWNPTETNLTNFIAQAIKGQIARKGQRLAAAAFSGSMYFHYLHGQEGLRCENVWVWQCDQCGALVASENCPTYDCHREFDPLLHRGVEERAQLFVPVTHGGSHELRTYWTCPKKDPTERECRNLYGEDLDKCPLQSCGGDLEGTSRPSMLWRFTGQTEKAESLADPQIRLDVFASKQVLPSLVHEQEDMHVAHFIQRSVEAEWTNAHHGQMTKGHWSHFLEHLQARAKAEPQALGNSFQALVGAIQSHAETMPVHRWLRTRSGCQILRTAAIRAKAVLMIHEGAEPAAVGATLRIPQEDLTNTLNALKEWLESSAPKFRHLMRGHMNGDDNTIEKAAVPAGAAPPNVHELVNALLAKPFNASEGCYHAQNGFIVQISPVPCNVLDSSPHETRLVDLHVQIASQFLPAPANLEDEEADMAMRGLCLFDLQGHNYLQRMAACQRIGQLGALTEAARELLQGIAEQDANVPVRAAASSALTNAAETRLSGSHFVGLTIQLHCGQPAEHALKGTTDALGHAMFERVPAGASCRMEWIDELLLTFRVEEAYDAVVDLEKAEHSPNVRERLRAWSAQLARAVSVVQSQFGRGLAAAGDAMLPTEAEFNRLCGLLPWAFEELFSGARPSLMALQPAIRIQRGLRVRGRNSRWISRDPTTVTGGESLNAPVLVERISTQIIRISAPVPDTGECTVSRFVLLIPIRPTLPSRLEVLTFVAPERCHVTQLQGVDPSEYLFALEPLKSS